MGPGWRIGLAGLLSFVASAAAAGSDGRNRELGEALARREPAAVRAALDSGADPDADFGDGLTPLMLAAQSGDADLVALLAARGARASARTPLGHTALMAAVQAGLGDPPPGTVSAVVRAVLALGPEVDARRDDGTTSLMLAVGLGVREAVPPLIAAGADVDAANAMGRTPLMEAASRGDRESLAALLAAGADVDRSDRGGDTALMLAARDGHAAAVRALLEAGADPSLRNASGRGAADFAAWQEDPEISRLIAQAPGGDGPAHRVAAAAPAPDAPHGVADAALAAAVAAGNADAVRGAVAAGAGVDRVDEAGTTSLMTAARDGRVALVDALLASGADPTRRDAPYGRTALGWAAWGGHVAAGESIARQPRTLPVLRADLAPESTPEARGEAIFALGFARDAGAVPGLVAILRDDRDPETRAAALRALDRIDDPAALEEFDAVAAGPDDRLAAAAVPALARWHGAAAVPQLRSIILDAPAESARRRAAMAALAERGEGTWVGRLERIVAVARATLPGVLVLALAVAYLIGVGDRRAGLERIAFAGGRAALGAVAGVAAGIAWAFTLGLTGSVPRGEGAGVAVVLGIAASGLWAAAAAFASAFVTVRGQGRVVQAALGAIVALGAAPVLFFALSDPETWNGPLEVDPHAGTLLAWAVAATFLTGLVGWPRLRALCESGGGWALDRIGPAGTAVAVLAGLALLGASEAVVPTAIARLVLSGPTPPG